MSELVFGALGELIVSEYGSPLRVLITAVLFGFTAVLVMLSKV